MVLRACPRMIRKQTRTVVRRDRNQGEDCHGAKTVVVRTRTLYSKVISLYHVSLPVLQTGSCCRFVSTTVTQMTEKCRIRLLTFIRQAYKSRGGQPWLRMNVQRQGISQAMGYKEGVVLRDDDMEMGAA